MENIEIKLEKDLPFGENIHQAASIGKLDDTLDYEILSEEKEIHYIDFLNLSEAVKILAEFFDVNCAVVVNEAKISSVALGASLDVAFEKAIDGDPVAILGGTAGFSKEVSLDVAKKSVAMKVVNILAPRFTKEALEYLQKHSEVNIVKINTPLQELLGFASKDIKVTPFGVLVQEQNKSKLTKSSFKVVTKNKPNQQQAEDAIFAWKVAKYLQTKAVVIVKDLSTKSIVQGQLNEISAVEAAMDCACENSKDAVLAVDGAIDSEQVINTAIQGRIGLIIEAGNSKNSEKIAKLAEKYNISVIFTNIRNNEY